MDWPSAFLAVGTASVAVIGTLVGSWLQHHFTTSRAQAEARSERVREGAQILARAEILLSDGNPDRLGINLDRINPRSAWEPLYDEWMKTLRFDVAAFALADTSPQVRDVGRRLVVAVYNSLTMSAWLLRDLSQPTPGIDLTETRERALRDHAEAEELVRELMALVRGEKRGEEVATSKRAQPSKERAHAPSEGRSGEGDEGESLEGR